MLRALGSAVSAVSGPMGSVVGSRSAPSVMGPQFRTFAVWNKVERGIIHSKRSTGNNVSHSKRRTKRLFEVNINYRRLYSEVLDEMVGPIHVSASGLRDIDKIGGLDNYVLRNPWGRTAWKGPMKTIRSRITQENKLRIKYGDAYVPRRQRDAGALLDSATTGAQAPS